MFYLLPAVTIIAIAIALFPMMKKANPAAMRRRVYANLGLVCAAVVLTAGMSVSVFAQDETKTILLADSSEQASGTASTEEETAAISDLDPADAVPSALATEEDKTNPETGALIQNAPEVAALEPAAAESAATQADNGTGLGYLAAALCTGLSCIGAGIAIAATAPAAIGAFSENPQAFGKALIFVVLGEGVALYGVIISFLLMNKF